MKVIFSANALKQLKKLDKPTSSRIVAYMAEVAKLQNPRDRGKMLVGNLLGFWRYRVGDYRILCRIKDNVLVITVVDVGHRREVYDK